MYVINFQAIDCWIFRAKCAAIAVPASTTASSVATVSRQLLLYLVRWF